MNEGNVTIYEHDHGDAHLRQVFFVTIFGNRVFTTVTRRASVVKKWISKIRYDHRYIRDRLVVGLGVQWRPPTSNRVATLQLCVGRQCLIFQIIHANNIPEALWRFLSDESLSFVGIRNENDSRLLRRDYGLSVNRIFELGSVANLRNASMETLASRFLGFHGIYKPEWIGRSDWDDYWLTMDQIQYACVDAYISFEIGKSLKIFSYA